MNAFMLVMCRNSIYLAGTIVNAAPQLIHLAGAIMNAVPLFHSFGQCNCGCWFTNHSFGSLRQSHGCFIPASIVIGQKVFWVCHTPHMLTWVSTQSFPKSLFYMSHMATRQIPWTKGSLQKNNFFLSFLIHKGRPFYDGREWSLSSLSSLAPHFHAGFPHQCPWSRSAVMWLPDGPHLF